MAGWGGFQGLTSESGPPVPGCPGEAVLCAGRIRRARGEGRTEEEKEGRSGKRV